MLSTKQEVIVNSIYNLGRLVKPGLQLSEVEQVLGVEDEGKVGIIEKETGFIFKGKMLAVTNKLEGIPELIHTELEDSIKTRACHLDDTYIFTEDGRVYDSLFEGYIKTEETDTVQVTIDRLVINLPKQFISYYVNGQEEEVNKVLEYAVNVLRNRSTSYLNKLKEEEQKARLEKEKEAQSERYHHHKEIEGMYLFHTPYVLTEEGRVYDKELGKLRAVNNRGYTTNLRKGFTIPMNLSISNVKYMLETQDFKILIERGGYTEHQCQKMWEFYQKQQQEQELHKEEMEITNEEDINDMDRIAEESGFIRTEEGYFVHKSFV